jgi:hypothetical protein
MTRSVVNIEAAYGEIVRGNTPGAAFARFEGEVDGWEFDEAELVSHARSASFVEKARALQAVIPGMRSIDYFAGSGIVVLARNAMLMAAVYHGHDNDPVAHQYGPGYRKMGFIKMGRAALASRLVSQGSDTSFVDGYKAVQQEVYGGAEGSQHTVGYAWRRTYTDLWVAGASGMLASQPVQNATETLYDNVVQRDVAQGLVTWPGDYFAGYHDQVAAEGALAECVGISASHALPNLSELDHNQVNLH